MSPRTSTPPPSPASSSTTPSPASSPASAPLKPPPDPFHTVKEEMKRAQEARVVQTAVYIRNTSGEEAAFKYELSEGIIHRPPLRTMYGINEYVSGLSQEWEEVRVQREVGEKVREILASERPQEVLDGMGCEDEGERRVWAGATRALRERRGGGGGVRISKA